MYIKCSDKNDIKEIKKIDVKCCSKIEREKYKEKIQSKIDKQTGISFFPLLFKFMLILEACFSSSNSH